MKVPLKYFPSDIIDCYELHNKAYNNNIYVVIKKGMYGLKQGAVLLYDNLVKNLSQFGYEPIDYTESYWKHKTTRTSKICLCLNDFGVKYFSKSDILTI